MAQARSVVLGAAFAFVAACGSTSPTEPSPGNPQPAQAVQEGTWRGAIDIEVCTRGSRECYLRPENFALRIGPARSGVLQIDTHYWEEAPPIAVDVAPAGGPTPGGPWAFTGSSTLLDADISLTVMDDTLEGTLRYAVKSGNGLVFEKAGRILFAYRDTTIRPSRFQGDWVGFVTRTQCSGQCEPFDAVVRNRDVTLLISQAGGSISGRFNSFEITGTATGESMRFSGRYGVSAASCRPGFDSGALCFMTLSGTATADAFDRLRGSITYRVEWVDDAGRPFALDATADLAGLVRWP